jgi:hypothetical protein
MANVNESMLLDDMDDTVSTLEAVNDDKSKDRSRARRSLEEYLEKKALKSRLRDTYRDDNLDLSELGW